VTRAAESAAIAPNLLVQSWPAALPLRAARLYINRERFPLFRD